MPPCAVADHFICPFPPPGNTPGVRRRGGRGGRNPEASGSLRIAKVVQRFTAERRPCGDRSFGRILPLSACQGHGVSAIRTDVPPTAPHGPRPHAGPRIPLGGNET
ncbi:hypothetical protein ACFXPN_13485 [Streptomyces griseorubiginosus]|uniref:hypothetical protein n=1 Tax=Streptomyces griseorubiginosus TaxID=67304 RepID=UPI0036B8961C